MPKDQIFDSFVKYAGIFNLKEFYNFSYTWLKEEEQMKVIEDEYEEKIKGPEKEVIVKWTCKRKIAEYFHYEIKVEFTVRRLKEVEVTQGGAKYKTNDGEIKVKVKGTILKDPKEQFETSATMKVWRGIYEKFIIPSRVKQYEDKLVDVCNNYLAESKAFLDIEGRR